MFDHHQKGAISTTDSKCGNTPRANADLATAGKERWNYEFLFLQTIGILAVVFGHGGNGIPFLFKAAFPYYSWHMPFFVFISGYFFRPEGSLGSFIKKKTLSRLLPAFCINLLYGILSIVMHKSGLTRFESHLTLETLLLRPFVDGHQFGYNVAMWFIFQLIAVETLSAPLLLTGKRDVHIALLAASLLLCAGALQYTYQKNMATGIPGLSGFELVLNRTLFLLFFYILGFFYRRYWEKKIHFSARTIFIILTALALAQCFYLILTDAELSFATSHMNISALPAFFMPLVTSLTATIALLCIAKLLSPVLTGNCVVLWIGTHTRQVMYHHQLCFLLVNCLLFIVWRRWNPPWLFQFDPAAMYGNGWYTYPLSGHSLGTLPYILAGLFLPIGVANVIERIPRRTLRWAAWGFVYLMVMGALALAGQFFCGAGYMS